MDLGSLWAQIESEYSKRTDELRFFQNQLAKFATDNEKDQYRRALILLLYAHFEGFCKFSFTLYISTINGEGLKCKEINFPLAAAALHELFKGLRNPTSKSPEFKNALLDDAKLHIFARDREFVERSNDFENKTVAIPDEVVDTESNLKPIVLRKNLYRLGFQFDKFKSTEWQINRLLELRNGIAHGVLISGISEADYEAQRKSVYDIMTEIKSLVMKALTDKEYLRPTGS